MSISTIPPQTDLAAEARGIADRIRWQLDHENGSLKMAVELHNAAPRIMRTLDALLATLSSTERETWWLAERFGHGLYAASRDTKPSLTPDPWRAVRFKTEREAFDFILRLTSLRDEMRQTEHVFINKFPLTTLRCEGK